MAKEQTAEHSAGQPAEQAETHDGFTFTVDEAGPARKRLTIAVTADMVDSKIEEAMGSIQTEAALPGFRKGRAPRHLIERRFGEGMKTETRNQLVGDAYRKCLEIHALKPLGDPQPVDPDLEIELTLGKPLEFAVEIEVVPDFTLPDFSTMTIKKPMLEVDDTHIDAELERQCLRQGSGEELEKGFKPADRLLGAATLRVAGEEEALHEAPQILVVLPEKGEAGAILGLLIDDLNKAFSTQSVGSTVTLKTTGPEGHEREDIRGKELQIDFTVQVAERITPCTKQELIDTFSLASEDVLREQIRLALEQQRDEEQSQVLREQAMNQTVEAIELELPTNFSEVQIARDLERVRMELLQQGMEAEEVETKLAEIREQSADKTRNRVKGFFVLARIADDAGVSVSEQELNGAIATMAMRQGVRPDKLRSELAKQDRLQQMAMTLRDRKAMDHIASQMTQEDISVDAWKATQEQS